MNFCKILKQETILIEELKFCTKALFGHLIRFILKLIPTVAPPDVKPHLKLCLKQKKDAYKRPLRVNMLKLQHAFSLAKSPYPVAVVIPIYKSVLSEYEAIALDRVFKVLSDHPLKIVAPEGLLLNHPRLKATKIEFFEASYFQGREGYNRLMLSPEFYRRFLSYQYILIYQLDAFVFQDDLLSWCEKKFDYIGAPWHDQQWLMGWSERASLARKVFKKLNIPLINRVGNGGLSLRNVRSSFFASLMFAKPAKRWLAKTGNEDLFWSYYVTSYLPLFKVADFHSAIKFSFETMPHECYEQTAQTLPFGCHAWDRPENISFWRPIFKDFGYKI